LNTLAVMRNYYGSVVALFPELPGSRKPGDCLAYVWPAGGFQPLDYDKVMRNSRPAKTKEYREFLKALSKQDFPVNLIQQASPIMHERRKRAAEDYRPKEQ